MRYSVAMADAKTKPSDRSVADHIAGVTPDVRRQDAERLDSIFRDITGWAPRMWGDTMIGYGSYDYTYATGRSGSMLATGFAPRKANLVLYIMPGYADFGAILDRLGPHKMGKSCLYITRLARVDETALRALIRAGLDNLATHWPVHPS